MKNKPKIGIGLIFTLGSIYWAIQKFDPNENIKMEFEFWGCKGDWPSNLAMKPIVSIAPSQEKKSYLVRSPETCGVSIKNPEFNISRNVLLLSYETHAEGLVAACFCDYQSRFTFTNLPDNISSVRFSEN